MVKSLAVELGTRPTKLKHNVQCTQCTNTSSSSITISINNKYNYN